MLHLWVVGLKKLATMKPGACTVDVRHRVLTEEVGLESQEGGRVDRCKVATRQKCIINNPTCV